MNVAVFAYSRQGCKTAKTVISHFAGQQVRAYTMERFEEPGFAPIQRPSQPFYGPVFQWADAMVFVGSVGIAVREIAPFVKDKRTDPAVIVMDELAHFVIPLLSGHIGGANQLALELAEVLSATPVITTATDINHKFSVDAWAARNGLAITNMHEAKAVSAAILEHPVPLVCRFPVEGSLPAGVVYGEGGELGICISCCKEKPFAHTLLLVPPVLRLGIGCRRGVSVLQIEQAVEQVLEEHKLHPKAIGCVCSIELKADEQGLLEFCQKRNLPTCFYTVQQLQQVPGEFTASQRVLQVTGVDNVCERAAMAEAETLLVPKTACHGVTVAIAQTAWKTSF